MPTKAEINARLVAARAEIERLQQNKRDLAKVQADLADARAEVKKLRSSKPDPIVVQADGVEPLRAQVKALTAENGRLRAAAVDAESLREAHSKAVEKVRAECESRIQDVQRKLDLAASANKATVDRIRAGRDREVANLTVSHAAEIKRLCDRHNKDALQLTTERDSLRDLVVELRAENKMLRSQYKPTSDQVRALLEENERLRGGK